MRMVFDLEKFVPSLGNTMEEREKDMHSIFSASCGREVCHLINTRGAEVPILTSYVNVERPVWGAAQFLDPGNRFCVNLPCVSEPTSALPTPSNQHNQAPYLRLWSHLSERRQAWETEECLIPWEWWWGRSVWDNTQYHSTHVLALILKSRSFPSCWVTFSLLWVTAAAESQAQGERVCLLLISLLPYPRPIFFLVLLRGRGCVFYYYYDRSHDGFGVTEICHLLPIDDFLCLRLNFLGYSMGGK